MQAFGHNNVNTDDYVLFNKNMSIREDIPVHPKIGSRQSGRLTWR